MPYEPPIVEPERATLPRLLAEAGYGTACVGKWHLGFRYPRRGDEATFTTSEADIDFERPLEGGPCDVGFDAFFGTAGCSTSDPPYAFIADRHTVGIPRVPSSPELARLPGFFPGLMVEGFDIERVDVHHVEKAIAFIDGHRRRRPEDPFFLYLALSAPHNPWVPPDFVRGRSGEGPRGDMNALVDWCVGRITEALDERGLRDDTLLIFTSDHGPMPGQHGQASAGSWRGHKNTAFEGGHRVPFVARWPARVPGGRTADDLVCHADLFATFADLLGVALPDDAAEDSFSILPALLGDEATAAPRRPLRPALVTDAGGLNASVGDLAVREGSWKLVVLTDPDNRPLAAQRELGADVGAGVLLFDLATDPAERTDVAAHHPEVVARLGDLLERTRARGARFLDHGAAPPPAP
jgi:arylsulfatase A-like enzyme